MISKSVKTMGQLQYTSADEEKQIKNSLIKSFVSLE
jgi:hypothetical protein